MLPSIGRWRFELERWLVHVDGVPVHLTPRETALLAYLLERPGVAVSRDELLTKAWHAAPGVLSRAVDFTLHRLRQKVEADAARPELLLTVRGEGVCLMPPPTPQPAPSVERAATLDAIAQALRPGATLAVTGAPGMGKSHLLTEVVARWPNLAVRIVGDDWPSLAEALSVSLEGCLDDAGVLRRIAGRLEKAAGCLVAIDDASNPVPSSLRTTPACWLLAARRAESLAADEVIELAALGPDAATAFLRRRVEALRGNDALDPRLADVALRLHGVPLWLAQWAPRIVRLGVEGVLRALDAAGSPATYDLDRDLAPLERAIVSVLAVVPAELPLEALAAIVDAAPDSVTEQLAWIEARGLAVETPALRFSLAPWAPDIAVRTATARQIVERYHAWIQTWLDARAGGDRATLDELARLRPHLLHAARHAGPDLSLMATITVSRALARTRSSEECLRFYEEILARVPADHASEHLDRLRLATASVAEPFGRTDRVAELCARLVHLPNRVGFQARILLSGSASAEEADRVLRAVIAEVEDGPEVSVEVFARSRLVHKLLERGATAEAMHQALLAVATEAMLPPGSRRNTAHLMLGRALVHAHRPEAAERHLRLVLERKVVASQAVPLHLNLLEAVLDRGEPGAVARTFDDAEVAIGLTGIPWASTAIHTLRARWALECRDLAAAKRWLGHAGNPLSASGHPALPATLDEAAASLAEHEHDWEAAAALRVRAAQAWATLGWVRDAALCFAHAAADQRQLGRDPADAAARSAELVRTCDDTWLLEVAGGLVDGAVHVLSPYRDRPWFAGREAARRPV